MKIIVVLLLLVFAGCGIPKAIATSIDFLDTVLSVAVKETATIEDDKQRATIAVNALKRAAPHAENLRIWVEREKPNAD